MKRTDNRRYLITVLAGIMAAVLVFSGCGSDDKGKTIEESSAASPAEEPLKEETEEEAPKETA